MPVFTFFAVDKGNMTLMQSAHGGNKTNGFSLFPCHIEDVLELLPMNDGFHSESLDFIGHKGRRNYGFLLIQGFFLVFLYSRFKIAPTYI